MLVDGNNSKKGKANVISSQFFYFQPCCRQLLCVSVPRDYLRGAEAGHWLCAPRFTKVKRANAIVSVHSTRARVETTRH